jgi:hypothetical protein
MTDREAIGKFLADDANGTCEQWVVRWQLGLLGDFESALAGAIVRADEGNLERLGQGFPTQVSAYLAWSRGDMAQRLRKAGLDL